jgi:hypothetical protein
MPFRSADLHSPHTAGPDARVVMRFPAVGDLVLLTVLLEALRQRNGTPVHLLASGPWTPVLLPVDPAVSALHGVEPAHATLDDALAIVGAGLAARALRAPS